MQMNEQDKIDARHADFLALYAKVYATEDANKPLQYTEGERKYLAEAIMMFRDRVEAMEKRIVTLERKLKFKGR